MVKIDLIVIGNLGSGKTSLIARYIDSDAPFVHNYLPTLGMNLQKKELIHKQDKLNVCVWDTAGQEKFFSLTKAYFQQADGVLLVFDICDYDSFVRIEEYWIKQVQESIKNNSCCILIGNKLDLQESRKVKYVQAQELAQKHKMRYFECSAKSGEGVQEAFNYMAKLCYDNINEEVNEMENIQIDSNKQPPQSCFGSIMSLFKKT